MFHLYQKSWRIKSANLQQQNDLLLLKMWIRILSWLSNAHLLLLFSQPLVSHVPLSWCYRTWDCHIYQFSHFLLCFRCHHKPLWRSVSGSHRKLAQSFSTTFGDPVQMILYTRYRKQGQETKQGLFPIWSYVEDNLWKEDNLKGKWKVVGWLL